YGVDREVPGDREQPRRHRAPTGVVGAGVAPGPHEGLLRDILRGAGVPDDRHGQSEDAALEALDEGCGRVGVSGRQACEQRIVGDSPHRDYAPAPRWDWESARFTVALPRPSSDLRLAEAVPEEAASRSGVGVEVIGDVPHVVVDVVLDG